MPIVTDSAQARLQAKTAPYGHHNVKEDVVGVGALIREGAVDCLSAVPDHDAEKALDNGDGEYGKENRHDEDGLEDCHGGFEGASLPNVAKVEATCLHEGVQGLWGHKPGHGELKHVSGRFEALLHLLLRCDCEGH